MSRVLRIMALLEALRSHDSTSTAELSASLGVSLRTLRRDLATLREQGLPITGEPGRGGGIRLEGGRGVTAVHLSVAEIVTLWLSAHLSRAASQLPWSDSAHSALAKLLGSLPHERARELRALCRRVIVGPAPTASMLRDLGPPAPELLNVFEAAFSSRRCLGFGYRDRDGRTSARRVEPHGLLVQSPLWYVLAYDLERAAPRMFRMDRMARPRLLRDCPFQPRAEVLQALLPAPFPWQPLLGAR